MLIDTDVLIWYLKGNDNTYQDRVLKDLKIKRFRP